MGLVVATCDLEGTMLSEIVREGQIYDFTYMWNLKNETNQHKTEIHRYREQTSGYQREEVLVGAGEIGKRNYEVYF